MNWFSKIALFLLPGLALLLSGCASVSSTAVFYSPMTTALYQPKDPHAVIPIMSERPTLPYTEIGKFAFQSDLGYGFMQKAIEYNARRVGADAVYIKESKSWSVPYYYTVPPSVTWIPVGGGYYGGCGGWYGGGAVIPIAEPGYSGVNYRNFTGIDARMIVFKR